MGKDLADAGLLGNDDGHVVAHRFERGDAERLPLPDAGIDVALVNGIFNLNPAREEIFSELARVVRPGGRIGMVEFAVPSSPVLRALWRVHTRVALPALGRVVSRPWFEVGRFLGPNIEALYHEQPDLPGLWRTAGIDDPQMRRMSFGAGLVMWGVRYGGATV